MVTPAKKYLEGSSGNLSESNNKDFSDLSEFEFSFVFEDEIQQHIINQQLDSITDSPEILKSLIQNITAIEFNDDDNSIGSIDVDDMSFTELQSFNALLKSPIFEIKHVNLEKLQGIHTGEHHE